ncbi:MAG: hypothetical protein L6Q84_17285 [Polyangiaceae bacterium]|nr:hypothetical protein [Polyangiaceae bacterium]
MLDKNERQFFAQEHAESVLQTVTGTLHAQGVPLAQTGPNQWAGRGQVPSHGIVPKVLVSMMPVQGGFFLEVRAVADIESNAIVLLIVLWLVFFPVAIILAVMAYQDWERRQLYLFQSVWAPLANRIAAPPGPQFGPPGFGYGGPR